MFCRLVNDGRCSHYVSSGYGPPVLKACVCCGKFGEHRSVECPDRESYKKARPVMHCRHCKANGEHWTCDCPSVVLKSDNPTPESVGTAKQAGLDSAVRRQGDQKESKELKCDQSDNSKRPGPALESECPAFKLPRLDNV